VGPYIGNGSSVSSGVAGSVVESRTHAVPGAFVGAGVDFRMGGHFTVGVDIGGDLPSNFSEDLAGTKNYRAFRLGVSFGWLWGRGHPPTP
jgi:hypothetical protein